MLINVTAFLKFCEQIHVFQAGQTQMTQKELKNLVSHQIKLRMSLTLDKQ